MFNIIIFFLHCMRKNDILKYEKVEKSVKNKFNANKLIYMHAYVL